MKGRSEKKQTSQHDRVNVYSWKKANGILAMEEEDYDDDDDDDDTHRETNPLTLSFRRLTLTSDNVVVPVKQQPAQGAACNYS